MVYLFLTWYCINTENVRAVGEIRGLNNSSNYMYPCRLLIKSISSSRVSSQKPLIGIVKFLLTVKFYQMLLM